MYIEFCVPDPATAAIVASVFAGLEAVTVTAASIVHGRYGALVTAGNSFGEMNGGVDGIINTHLSAYTPGGYIQERVKAVIAKEYAGELPVGAAIVVPTQHPRHTLLVYAPTMRVPEDVSQTLNAYLAFRATLVALQRAGVGAASTPLFCTAAGSMGVDRAARQMRAAYESVTRRMLVGGDWRAFHEDHRRLKLI